MAVTQIAREKCAELESNPGFYLRLDAALAWDRAVKKFGKKVLLTSSWRSYETQERLFRERYVRGRWAGYSGFTLDVRWWNGSPWTRRRGTAAAAVPGTSNHGGGVAVDVKTRRSIHDPGYDTAVIFTGWKDPDRIRFLAVAAEFGWADDEGRSVDEVWHITYYPERDRHRGKSGAKPGYNADGSKRIAQDGDRGPQTIARWQEVMGTPTDGKISEPSTLIQADQRFLNRVVPSRHIQALIGRPSLKEDGKEGPNTIKVRQFYLFNTYAHHLKNITGRRPATPRLSDFDGRLGRVTNTLHQIALNGARARSGRY